MSTAGTPTEADSRYETGRVPSTEAVSPGRSFNSVKVAPKRGKLAAEECFPLGNLVLRNKPPVWNPQVHGWSLNFMSRVKMPSVKNF